MLENLEIRDFALIGHVNVRFTGGLNVLTGETGAGKSIIIDALNAVSGGKVGPQIIRAGAEKAYIEATIALNAELAAWLKSNELADDEIDALVVSREISKSGSRCRINGTLVNLSVLQDLRQKIVTIHAQHEARTLLSGPAQLEMLDGLGDDKYRQLVAKVRTAHARRKDLQAQLSELTISEDERQRRLEFARFQFAELEEAQLGEADEDQAVALRQRTLANLAALETGLATAQECLSGGSRDDAAGASDLIGLALKELTRAQEFDDKLVPIADALNDVLERLEEQQRALRRYCDTLDGDPETLSALDERLAQLSTIKRKYGPSLAEAIARRDNLETELANLEDADGLSQRLQAEWQQADAAYLACAGDLSTRRQTLAKKLARTIETELAELGMERCKFEIAFAAAGEEGEGKGGASGLDRIEFMIAPNPGQPPMSLAKIGSGGELSRIMLVIKSIFAQSDKVATVVFDEIETGLSGAVLQAMRDKLVLLGRSHQILCITHQPIIASSADNHVHVEKQQTSTTTTIKVSLLTEDERLRAVAKMASGQDNQEEALSFARSLFADGARLRGR